MAMAAAGGGGGSGGRRRRGGRKHRPMSDINMTPFIDVMLVLLIIFMVAAPLMVTGVPLDLPQTKASPLNIDKQPLTISLKTVINGVRITASASAGVRLAVMYG